MRVILIINVRCNRTTALGYIPLENITIDSALSETSTNPVQNKAISEAIVNIQAAIPEVIGDIEDAGVGKVLDSTVVAEIIGDIRDTVDTAMPKSGGEFTGDTIFSVGGTKVWISFTDENGAPTTIPHLHWIEE